MKFNFLSLILLLVCSLFSCKDDKDETGVNEAFIGGEIVNPNSNYIVFKKADVPLDTVFLNSENRFSYKLSNFEPGFFGFFDGREYQNILVEPNDNLLLRLNTIDFDESLVFTGKGARENNFLMELYLKNEKDDENILGLGQKDAEEFDSIFRESRDLKLKKLEKLKAKYNTSPFFNEIAEKSINYEYYAHKELYPLANYKISELDAFNSLPEDFYDYRENIDYNDEDLKDYSPYVSFLRFHFNNIALQKHFSHSKDSEYNKLDLHYNLDKLELIDKYVSNEDIKNNLLKFVISQFITFSKNTEHYDAILESFKNKSTNLEDIKVSTQFINSYKRLKPGNRLPQITLLDNKDKEINLNELIKKPTVVYFWSKKNKNHLIYSHKRVKELNVKYPEFNFIAINVDSISYKEQVRILKRNEVRINNEYRFKSPKQSKLTLSVKPIQKVFILNKNGEIVNAKANMFGIVFEQELLGVLNQ
ncbi:TlpA family protein disulfide reductase [Lacinutrix venerupis]|nr:hypothetical protein [Lacinutrix venerupis]